MSVRHLQGDSGSNSGIGLKSCREEKRLTPEQFKFIHDCAISAEVAEHPFPKMAACEAALESSYGRSLLAIQDNNLFGMKQHLHPEYGTAILPSKEVIGGKWIPQDAKWIHYPSTALCFSDRAATLQRLCHDYPHYAAALRAPDAETYIKEVSKTWSTDPDRALKVLSIYREAGYGKPPAVEHP